MESELGELEFKRFRLMVLKSKAKEGINSLNYLILVDGKNEMNALVDKSLPSDVKKTKKKRF